MSTLTAYAVTFDAADALKLAQFWSQALGREVDADGNAEFASIGLSEDASRRPHLMFIKVPEAKTAKNRVHLDLITNQLDDEVHRLLTLGARRGDAHEESGATWVTLTDPEGNEFDVVEEQA